MPNPFVSGAFIQGVNQGGRPNPAALGALARGFGSVLNRKSDKERNELLKRQQNLQGFKTLQGILKESDPELRNFLADSYLRQNPNLPEEDRKRLTTTLRKLDDQGRRRLAAITEQARKQGIPAEAIPFILSSPKTLMELFTQGPAKSALQSANEPGGQPQPTPTAPAGDVGQIGSVETLSQLQGGGESVPVPPVPVGAPQGVSRETGAGGVQARISQIDAQIDRLTKVAIRFPGTKAAAQANTTVDDLREKRNRLEKGLTPKISQGVTDILLAKGINPRQATPSQIADARKQAQSEKIQTSAQRGTGIVQEKRNVFLKQPTTEISQRLTGSKTNREALKKGFVVFGRQDAKSQAKISEFEESATALGTMVSLLDDAKAIARGQPVTGLVGQAGELVDRLVGNVENAFRIAGVTPEQERSIRQSVESTVGSLETDDNSVISRFRQAGMDRQVLDAMVFSIAMEILIARGVRGNRLTATLIDRTIREIGGPTASTETFVKKIDSLQRREIARLSNRAGALLGKRLSSKQMLNAIRGSGGSGRSGGARTITTPGGVTVKIRPK